MPAARLNLTAERGANFSAVLTWRNEAGVLVDLTGYTAEMDVRTTRADTGTELLTLTTANGRIALGGVAGTIALTATAAVITALTAQTGWYDLVLTSGAGTVTRLVEGVFVVAERVTA